MGYKEILTYLVILISSMTVLSCRLDDNRIKGTTGSSESAVLPPQLFSLSCAGGAYEDAIFQCASSAQTFSDFSYEYSTSHTCGNWLTLDFSTGVLSGNPGFFDTGDCTVSIQLRQGAHTSGEKSFTFKTVAKPEIPLDPNGTGSSSRHAFYNAPANLGTKLLYPAKDSLGQMEYWVTDGTVAGSSLTLDISGAGCGTSPISSSGNGPIVFAGKFYILADDCGAFGEELYFSDGTIGSMTLVKDIRAGASNSSIENFTVVGNKLFFAANDGTNGTELYVTDGTVGNATLLEVRAGAQSSNPYRLIDVNGVLFFRATDGVNGYELWKSDGTVPGTVMVKDIDSTAANGMDANPGVTVFNDKLLFTGNDGVNGAEPWISDGTSGGTYMLAAIHPGAIPSNFFMNGKAVGSLYFFPANNGVNGNELWVTDGTTIGTKLVKDINPAGDGINNNYVIGNLNGKLLFIADDGVHGAELWLSDGTDAGTQMIVDIATGITSSVSSVSNGTFMGGKYYFSADTPEYGNELWVTDGTALGTKLVKDMTPGASGSIFPNMNYYKAIYNDEYIYFSVNDGTHGREPWVTNGTKEGTHMVMDINPSGDSMGFTSLFVVNGYVVFQADDGNGIEYWSVKIPY